MWTAENGLKACASGSQVARKGSWVERGGYPSIDHFRKEFWVGQLGYSAIYRRLKGLGHLRENGVRR